MGNSPDPQNNISDLAKKISDLLLDTDLKSSDLILSCLECITQIAEAAIESNWPSLNDICLLYQERLCALVEKGADISAEQFEALASWPQLVTEFVSSSSPQEAGSSLVHHLNLPCWNSKLSDMDVEILTTMLSMTVGDETLPASQEPGVKEKINTDNASTAPELSGELPDAVKELIKLLSAGLNDLDNMLKPTLETAMHKKSKTDDCKAVLETFEQQLGSFGEACESIGFKGLGQVCTFVQANILSLVNTKLTPEIANLLNDWITQVDAYLKVVTDPETAASLAVLLVDPTWPQPLPGDKAETLSVLLVAPEIPELEAEVPKRKQQATEEDVSLELPDDVDQDLLEALLQELPGQTEEFSTAIQNMINGGTLEDINVAQRVVHTLKGAGNTVGIRGMAIIAHNLEDILLALAKHETLPSEPLIEMMMNAADCLEAMGEGLAGLGELPDNAKEVLQDILDWANQIDRDGIPADAKPPVKEKDNVEKVTKQAEETQEKKSAKKDQSESTKTPTPMIRIPAALVDELLRLEGEEVIFTGQIHERLRRITRQSF